VFSRLHFHELSNSASPVCNVSYVNFTQNPVKACALFFRYFIHFNFSHFTDLTSYTFYNKNMDIARQSLIKIASRQVFFAVSCALFEYFSVT